MTPPRSFPVRLADSAWLRMEQPTNPMTITGVIVFEGTMPLDAMRRFMLERVVPYDRFRMRIETPRRGRARWVADEHFDIAAHVVEAELPAPGQDGLQRLVSRLMSEPLSLARSPWTLHLVHGLDGGDSAAVVRLHHVIGDGIALMHLLLEAADEAYHARGGTQLPAERPARARRSVRQRIARMARNAAAETVDLLVHPRHTASRLSSAAAGATALAKLFAMPPDSETILKGHATPDKRAAWTAPFDLGLVKAIGEATGAKVNDVLMSASAGALRAYFLEHGEPVDGVQVRVALPFNVRPLQRAHELGNSFGLAFVALPLGIPDARTRLVETKRRMDVVKRSSEPAVVFAILQSIGGVPRWIHQQVVDLFAQKASAVLTNVPGPTRPLQFEHVGIRSIMFWVPQAGDIGLGISILSLDGQVRVGVCSDAAYVPEPDHLARAFSDEFARLAAEFAPAYAGNGGAPAG